MTGLLRHGAAILLVAAILIFVISLFVGLYVGGMADQLGVNGPTKSGMLLGAVATALSNSVWAFGLACIVDRLDRHWGTRK